MKVPAIIANSTDSLGEIILPSEEDAVAQTKKTLETKENSSG